MARFCTEALYDICAAHRGVSVGNDVWWLGKYQSVGTVDGYTVNVIGSELDRRTRTIDGVHVELDGGVWGVVGEIGVGGASVESRLNHAQDKSTSGTTDSHDRIGTDKLIDIFDAPRVCRVPWERSKVGSGEDGGFTIETEVGYGLRFDNHIDFQRKTVATT